MAFKSLAHKAAVLVALLFLAFSVGVTVHADEIERLKGEVKSLEQSLQEAETAETEANKKVKENQRLQKDAKGEEKERLKAEGLKLAEAVRTAGNNRTRAAVSLAGKRSELRGEASKVAEEQITAAGDTNTRAKKAGDALSTWSAALGDRVPTPPVSRDTSKMDPSEAAEAKRDDKARLQEFVDWADKEKERLDTEIARADSLVKNENKFSGADAHDRLLNESKNLKSTLDTRKKNVDSQLRAAKEALRALER